MYFVDSVYRPKRLPLREVGGRVSFRYFLQETKLATELYFSFSKAGWSRTLC